MKKLLKFIVVCLTVISCKSSIAHNPDLVGYNFNLNKDEVTLTIHLTPKGAIDLIQYLKPELKDESIINLEDYYKEFSDYFNETIALKVNHRPVYFSFVKANLKSHDATLEFSLDNLDNDVISYGIKVESFLSIYKRIQNFVSFKVNGKEFNCQLNKENRQCDNLIESGIRNNNPRVSQNYLDITTGLGIGLFIGFLVWVRKK